MSYNAVEDDQAQAYRRVTLGTLFSLAWETEDCL